MSASPSKCARTASAVRSASGVGDGNASIIAGDIERSTLPPTSAPTASVTSRCSRRPRRADKSRRILLARRFERLPATREAQSALALRCPVRGRCAFAVGRGWPIVENHIVCEWLLVDAKCDSFARAGKWLGRAKKTCVYLANHAPCVVVDLLDKMAPVGRVLGGRELLGWGETARYFFRGGGQANRSTPGARSASLLSSAPRVA